MSREITVGKKQHNTKPMITKGYTTTIKCDVCGKVIDPDEPPDDNEDLYAQELIILLNVSLCVNSRVRKDLCRMCLEPIWAKICEAIGEDPADVLRVGQE